MLDYEIDPDNVHVGPSDHVPWLEDRKWCYIRMEGTTFGDVPLNAELKLEVWDSPNSAGVITDAIRCLKLGLDRGLKGTLVAPSSYFMKSPPIQIHDDIAHNRVEAFIRGEDNETLVGTENLPEAAAQEARRRARRGRRPRAGEAAPDGPARADRPIPARRPRGAAPAREQRPADRREGRRRRLRGGDLGRRPRPGRLARWVIGTAPGGLPALADEAGLVERELRPGRGLPPDDPRVRRLALRAYREYARYLVEVMRLESLSPDEAVAASSSADLDADRDDLARSRRRADLRPRPRRQQRGGRGRGRRPGLADQRRRRRLERSPRCSSVPPAARGVGRPRHPVAQPARDLRGPQAPRDARPPDRLGLPVRRDPGPAVRLVDDAPGGPGDPRREDRLADPAGRDPARRRRHVPRLVLAE